MKSIFLIIFLLFVIVERTSIKADNSKNSDEFLKRKNCEARCFAKCIQKERGTECTSHCKQYLYEKYCSENECLTDCKDLGPPTDKTPSPPNSIAVKYDEHFRLEVHWNAVEKADFYIVSYGGPHTDDLKELFITGNILTGHKIDASILCNTVDVRVASASLAGGRGTFSTAAQLKRAQPNVTLQVQSLTLENKPYFKDGYESNQTVHLTLQYNINQWIYDNEDIVLKPLVILHNCKDPDLANAVPEATLIENREKRTFETELAASLMYRRCLFVASFEQIHSRFCKADYSFSFQRPLSIALNCNTVANCKQTSNLYKAPICGRTENFKSTVVNASDIQWDDENAPITVNITFDFVTSYGRSPKLSPLYYLARYGNAIEHNTSDEKSLLGVSLVDELGIASNCLSIRGDGSCGKYATTNNSILLANLTSNKLYGVMICAVLDSRNLTLPLISVATARHLRVRADRVQIRSVDYRAPSVWRNLFGASGAIASAFGVLFVLLASILCVWSRRQRAALERKKISLEVMRRQEIDENRYVDLPKKTDVWELERQNLIIYEDRPLGSGAFGAVYLGRLIGAAKGSRDAQSALGAHLARADNCDVAVKMLPEYADELSKSEFLREIALMKTLGYHERLVNMLACVTRSEPYCLVVEYCGDGDLLRFLRSRRDYMLKLDELGINYAGLAGNVMPPNTAEFDSNMVMTVRQLLQFTVQISYGLEYLSQKGFVHRDVAARNVLVQDGRYAKIGDFGLCRYVYAQTANYKGNGGRLPVKWMSPEAIRDYEFTTQSDVWSFGVLMFEVITLGGTPYPGLQPHDILNYLESGKRLAKPDNCPDAFYEVMSMCWALKPSNRPHFATIRRNLALQLEATADEYSYLRLDAQKDYYNVEQRELREQAGEDVQSAKDDSESL